MITKVGILTFHTSVNYGAYMQAYSFSKMLNTLPSIYAKKINYEIPKIEKVYKKHAYNILNLSSGLSVPFKLTKRISVFRNELKHLPLSKLHVKSDDFIDLFQELEDKYDIIVVGSDAVWNWSVRGFPNAYLLNGKFQSKKFSYAASSHGMDYSKLSEYQKEYLNEAWKDYYFIGVRDNATAEFVRSICPTANPIHTCDPTIFFDLNKVPIDIDKLEYKLKKRNIDIKKPIVGFMGGYNLGKMVRALYGNKYQLVALYDPNKYADCYISDLTPFEWAHIFKYFKVTFTTYFHGTLLSLKNGTPTISIEALNSYSRNYNTKLKDVLNRLKLSDCLFQYDELDKTMLEKIELKADNLIINPESDKILNSIVEEAKSFESFKSVLNQAIIEK